MFVKNVLKDSFKELKVALKNPKVFLFTLIIMSVNVLLIFRYNITLRPPLMLIPIAIVSLFLITFQYNSLGRIIHSKDKKIVKDMSLGFITRFFKLLEVLFVLLLIGVLIAGILIGVFAVIEKIVSIGNGGYGLAFVIERFYKVTTLICFFLFMLRALLCIPLCILDDTIRPIHLSLEITKGYVWRLIIVDSIIPGILIFLIKLFAIFMLMVLHLNLTITGLIILPISTVVTILSIIIMINSMYYLMNKDLLDVRKIESEVESV